MHPLITVRFIAKEVKQAILCSKSKLKEKWVNVFISEDTYFSKNRALVQLKKKKQPSNVVIRNENLNCYMKTPRLKN